MELYSIYAHVHTCIPVADLGAFHRTPLRSCLFIVSLLHFSSILLIEINDPHPIIN